jgi:octaprenyl-diphosphate synthase
VGPTHGHAHLNPTDAGAGEPSAIDRLTALLADDLAAVDALIHTHMQSPVGLIPNLAAHLIDAGGKRIRPLVTLASARLFGGGGDAPRKLAAAVEFIHTATLLHDDVVDDSGLRRGRASANRLWGNPSSVLVGDFLFARSFTLMVEVGDVMVLDILANAASVIAEGEVMQLAAANDSETSGENYMAIVAAKTAALFAAAAKVGAVAAGRPGTEAEAMSAYGREIGLAFQLVDDALDYGGKSATMGKNAGDDFREGKITLPVVYARERGDETERDFWRRTMSGERSDEDFAHAVALVRRHGAIERTLETAQRHADSAKRALANAPSNAYRTSLTELADFVVSRAC